MRSWLRGPCGGLLAFLLVVGLVGGGLGWTSMVLLRLEQEQQQARAEAEVANNVRLALWRLDTSVTSDLAREEGRPYNHYSFLSRHPRTLVQRNNRLVPDATVLQLSPLLTAELPEWILLHFQADESGWSSPQVPPRKLVESIKKMSSLRDFRNQTSARATLLEELKDRLPAKTMLAAIDQRGGHTSVPDNGVMLAQVNPVQPMQMAQQEDRQQQPIQPQMQQGGNFGQLGQFGFQGGQPNGNSQNLDFNSRGRVVGQGKRIQENANTSYIELEDNLLNDLQEQGAGWLNNDNNRKNISGEVALRLTSMVPAWVNTGNGREHLVLVREIQVEKSKAGRICQGVVLDTSKLQAALLEQVADLFPEAKLEPIRDFTEADPARSMAWLPFQLETGPVSLEGLTQGWTPLRIGLALTWLAAGLALLAVGLGGWSLIDLSERRFRFVSAVTHELRTPLTTLRLYLDMLLGGMVREEKQREEYLRTLHDEADRLNRLVNNVLDYSRLEKQRPRLNRQPVAIEVLLDGVRETWQGRCKDAGKMLIVENELDSDAEMETDMELVQQVLANLIDNACKYSREADDPRVCLRAIRESGRVVFEVEDRGPGVPARERRAIFRAFRRGSAGETTGGVGLGLALAERWARLLGGRLILRMGGPGACFRLELPLS